MVVVCGNLVLDILAHPIGEVRWAATTIVDGISQQLGGNAGTTSYTLGKLGIPVSIVTLVGRDESLLETLTSAGVDISLVQRVDAPTSTAISLVRPDGERALLYHLGAAAQEFSPFAFPPHATHFHLAAVFRMQHLRRIAPELLKRAREAGLTTSLDTQWDTENEWMKVLAPSLPHADYTLMNEAEARMLTGRSEPARAAEILRDHGATHVIVKLGARGCWVDGTVIPGHPVKAIDTTGAGDCFNGGFLAGLQRGLRILEAARIANTVGALSVQKVGATAGVVDWDTIIRAERALWHDLSGAAFRHKRYVGRPGWQHDHCAACGVTLSEGEGYAVVDHPDGDDAEWVCEACFETLREPMGWLVVT